MIKILLFGAIFVSSTAQGKDQQIQCPARYPLNVVHLKDVPKGWNGEGYVRGALPLLGASYVEGPITGSSYGEIIGGPERKTKDGSEKRYNMDGQIKEKWIVCRYGNDGNIELFHRVAAESTQCVIRTRQPDPPNLPVVNITCKS